jgi:dolichol-phosphate mannosyltransferase
MAIGRGKTIVAVFAYNEGAKIQRVLSRLAVAGVPNVLIMDDGSTDESLVSAEADFGVRVLRNARNLGIGASMKRAFSYVLEQGAEILVIMAGNDKDDPTEIPRLLAPIKAEGYDFVQGSRFLPGGGYGQMPAYRVLATRFLHPWLFTLATRRRVVDSTNGFRAFRTAILRDPRVDWRQEWLDRYELEPYILFKSIHLGYRYREVPVHKVYPPRAEGYTKMKPGRDWWSILRPVVLLGLGLRT